MALVVGTNSYVDVAQATTYCADRLDADAWTNATEQQKSAALITATKRIDMQRLRGVKADSAQALQFPRRYPVDGGYVVDEDVPQVVLDATCEEALFMLSLNAWDKQRERQHALGVVGQSVGDANEYAQQTVVQAKATGGQGLLSPVARQLLAPYMVRSTAIV